MGYLTFALLGIGAGAVYAGFGLGLVLTYRGSGIVNFAQGGVAAWALFVYAEMRNSGTLVLPAGTIHLGSAFTGVWPGIVLGIAVAALIDLLMYMIVFRSLRTAPVLSRVVASVGLAVMLVADLVIRFGANPISVASVFPTSGLHLAGGLTITEDRLLILGSVAILVLGLELLSRFTRFGLSSRAAAKDEVVTRLLGYSPTAIGAVNWILAGAVTALLAILAGYITGASSGTYDELLVPALGAMLIGGLESLWITAAAGLVIGMLQSELAFLNTFSWMPSAIGVGDQQTLPFLIIVGYLFWRGRSTPGRAEEVTGRLPRAGTAKRPVLSTGIAMVASVGLMLILHGSLRLALIDSLITAMLLLSLVVITGLLGQVSLVQSALAGIGAFGLTRLGTQIGIPFPWCALLAVALTAGAGLVIGFPALRIRGIHLALVTVAGAVAIEGFVFQNPFFTGNLNGGVAPEASFFGVSLNITGPGGAYPHLQFGIFVAILVSLVGGAIALLSRSRLGRKMLAIRDNERAAAAAGVAVARLKLIGVVISAAIAGLAGSLTALQDQSISADSFSVDVGLTLLVLAYLGGITTVSGAVIGGLLTAGGLIFAVVDHVVNLGTYATLIGGAGVVVATLQNPDGISGEVRKQASRVREKVGRRPPVKPVSASPLRLEREPSHSPEIRQPSPGRASRNEPAVLSAEGITVTAGSVRINNSMTVEVYRAEIVGLIGPNGAGKTTLIDAITGYIESAGAVKLDGIDVSSLTPELLARRGLRRTFQSLESFGELTVLENVEIAHPPASSLSGAVTPREALDFFNMANKADERPGALSFADERLLGLARMMAGGPAVAILDEPAAGLDPEERTGLSTKLRRLRENGLSILLIDHDTDLIFELCDYVYVMDVGNPLAEGTPEQIQANADVRAAYLGERWEDSSAVPLSGAREAQNEAPK